MYVFIYIYIYIYTYINVYKCIKNALRNKHKDFIFAPMFVKDIMSVIAKKLGSNNN